MNKLTHTSFILLACCCLVLVNLVVGQNKGETVESKTLANTPNCEPVTTKPNPKIEKYNLKTCIVSQFASYLTVGPGKYLEMQKPFVNTSISNCEDDKRDPKLVIVFECGSVSIDIGRNNESKIYVKAITGQYQLKNETLTFANSTPTFFASQDRYYRCNSEQTIAFDNVTSLVVNNLALEAYRNANDTNFYKSPGECALDSQPVSDMVRVGVGLSLLALAVIVLIAYYFGRKRWLERSSYESV